MLFGLLDRDSQVALIFAALVAGGCGGGGDGGERRELVDTGWGNADTYHTTPVELVEEAADRGFRFVVTERRPTVQAKDWRRGELPDRFPEIEREINRRACARGMIHIAFVWNWNIPVLRARSDQWAIEDFERALEVYDPACTWLEPVVEPDEENAKARRWYEIAAARWTGVLILPDAGRHWPVRHDFVDFHPGSVGEAEHRIRTAGPGTLIITDGGPFVHPPDVLSELGRLTALALERGVPLIHYTDRYAPGDAGAHLAVMDAIAAGIP